MNNGEALNPSFRQRLADHVVRDGADKVAAIAGICSQTVLHAIGGKPISRLVKRALATALEHLEQEAL